MMRQRWRAAVACSRCGLRLPEKRESQWRSVRQPKRSGCRKQRSGVCDAPVFSSIHMCSRCTSRQTVWQHSDSSICNGALISRLTCACNVIIHTTHKWQLNVCGNWLGIKQHCRRHCKQQVAGYADILSQWKSWTSVTLSDPYQIWWQYSIIIPH